MTPAELELLKQQQANTARYLPNPNRPANMSAIAMPEASGAMVRQAPPPVANRMPMSKESYNDIEPGLLSRIGTGLQNLRADPVRMAKLQMGFNSMRLNPDAGIAASAADTIKMGETRRLDGLDANATMAYLSQQKDNPMAQAALAAIKANPSMTKDILSAFLTNQFKPQHMSKNIGSIQTAQEDMPEHGISAGDQFTYHLDPNVVGGYTLIKLGGKGTTETEKAQMTTDMTLRESDIKQARTKAKEYFNRYDALNNQISSLRQAKQLIEDGAETGWIKQHMPTFNSNTQLLRNVANEMGIDIINSATFGALSATELKLALSTGFPQGLNPAETIKYIDDKIKAQDKFRRELLKKTNRLNSGIGFTQWTSEVMEQEEREYAVANLPPNNQELIKLAADKSTPEMPITPQYIWDRMNYAQRKAFMDQEQK